MLYEMKGVCQHCASDYKILLVDSSLNSSCPECGESPIKIKKFKGLIYIISNPHQTGVKVGLTTKDVHERMRQLSSTGVAGIFELIALFPSDRPKVDEKKAHDKLKKYHITKEHFDTTPLIATQSVFRALNRKTPIFYNSDIEQQFNDAQAENRVIMNNRLAGNSDVEISQATAIVEEMLEARGED
jgi:hypothetical protein